MHDVRRGACNDLLHDLILPAGRSAARKKTHLSFLSALSLCLSRACLGKAMIICSLKWHRKNIAKKSQKSQTNRQKKSSYMRIG
eukprot:COSAG06_NODE_3530_length_5224_cov_87.568865_4_plen_84_part_00